MEKAFVVLNEMVAQKLISGYALGGGMAALFYAEPVLTYDMDVFVFVPDSSGLLIDLSPLYGFLKKRGYVVKGECVVIADIPVQLIPAYNPLVDEAVREAKKVKYKGAPARICRPEHLIAIALQTGRHKDKERVTSFLKTVKIDKKLLNRILKKYGLIQKLQELIA